MQSTYCEGYWISSVLDTSVKASGEATFLAKRILYKKIVKPLCRVILDGEYIENEKQ